MKPIDQLTKDELQSEINAINMDDLGDTETWMRRELLTSEYYRHIQDEVKSSVGGNRNARLD